MKPPFSQITLKRIWPWMRLILGAAGLIILVTLIDIDETILSLRQANALLLVPAFVLLVASYITKTVRWNLLLQKSGVDISLWQLAGTYYIGTFYSQFMPGAAAGGDAMRMVESAVDTGEAATSVASILIERAIGLVSIAVAASLILTFAPNEGIPMLMRLLVYALAAGLIAILIVLRFGLFLGPILSVLRRFGFDGITRRVRSLNEALKGSLGSPATLAQMVLLSLLSNFFSMTAFYLALLAVSDPVPYLPFISLVVLIASIEIVPITPGALGIREGAYVFFLAFLGVDEPVALTTGLLVRLLTWSQALIGGGVLLLRGTSTAPLLDEQS